MRTTRLPPGSTSPSETSADAALATDGVPVSATGSQSTAAASTAGRTSHSLGTLSFALPPVPSGGMTVSGNETSPPLTPETIHSPPEPSSTRSRWPSRPASSPSAPAAKVSATTMFVAQGVSTGVLTGTAETGTWDLPNLPSTTSSSPRKTRAGADTGKSLGTSAPSVRLSEERVPTSSIHQNQRTHPASAPEYTPVQRVPAQW